MQYFIILHSYFIQDVRTAEDEGSGRIPHDEREPHVPLVQGCQASEVQGSAEGNRDAVSR